MRSKKQLTYKKAGVDIDKGDKFVSMIAPLARRTFRPEVITDIGSFGALFKLDIGRYKNPVLVSGTDGVGTKLKIAFMADRHDTVGIDLVAMCVNDILTCGAEPLFFLDYFATGKLAPDRAVSVVKGISDGCKEAGCSLVGGETAEMPGFYAKGEYDLSGFAVGVVDKNKIIDGRKIRDGDAVVGIASNGLHSNGYSLARKVFFGLKKVSIKKTLPETGLSLGEELLRPTKIYVKVVNYLKGQVEIKGMAHITGGGIDGNLPRILPEDHGAIIFEKSWSVQPIFELIRKLGNVPDGDMKRTFNMGIGYILVVPDGQKEKTVALLRKKGVSAFIIGRIGRGFGGVRYAKN
jgi:phosphoribosylformylglycinamidine cyclo-ligase